MKRMKIGQHLATLAAAAAVLLLTDVGESKESRESRPAVLYW